MYPSVFDDGVGTLPGKVHISVDRAVTPVALPVRRVPLAIKEKFKAELDRLADMGIIKMVDEPSDWVSQIALVAEGNGDLRICIDPKNLNMALRRERYALPTFDDILPQLAGAKLFTKVDLASDFWHVVLDEESSYLTTFGTPFGRFRWMRLPFGLCVASEIS